MSTGIFWFRRDLRLADNPLLAKAANECDQLLPLYVDDPGEGTEWAEGAASRWWLQRSLMNLDRELNRRGTRLSVRRGRPSEVLRNLVRTLGVERVYWNCRYEPQALATERDTLAALRLLGCRAESGRTSLLTIPESSGKPDGTPYRVFTAFWRARQRAGLDLDVRPAPARLPPPPHLPEAAINLPLAGQWSDRFSAHWEPGERAAERRLQQFINNGLGAYPGCRDVPARAGTSRLSPHLHFGEIGPRQIVAAVQAWAAESGQETAAESFLRQLGWREFAHHLLYHFPQTPNRPLDLRFERFRWEPDYRKSLTAWRRAETGFPIIDAGLRELWETGWMHNRVRLITASFLTKNLLVPWQEGAHWFWETLLDADLANNTLGWQWVAGCGADAAPWFRIFNPVVQAERFDPEGNYVRAWLPALRKLEGKSAHQPWKEGCPPTDYPPPMVDLKATRERALLRFRTLPKREGRR
ncbi:cryptochrome/photolyase family protein [Thiohalomonas denitrificans]|uniref:cryptochrome/photolyase family protein n=1 Tax=Thiohalomonas denitrificans TaxID=415747 RepID=UPI0026ED1DE6|nr:deoxyribodipyrimidine photo-lyase [Thiohalomonas denitrificans]